MQKFEQIKNAYDEFYRSLMKKGRLPMWSTEKGFWSASSSAEIFKAFKKIKLERYRNFLDIGSGDGKVVLMASLFCKNAQGVEIDRFLHKKAIDFQSRLGIKNVKFQNGDFFNCDFSKYDILFLSPDAPMTRGIEEKMLREMKGKLVHHGHHFHPSELKKIESFVIDGTMFTVFSRKKP